MASTPEPSSKQALVCGKEETGQWKLNTAAVVCISLIIAAVFILVNVWAIPRINPDPRIGGDASQYIALTRGNIDSVPSPFRFRILVPFLAALLPFSPGHALMVITYASLATLFVVLVRTSYRLTQDIMASVVGALLIFSSRWFLYNFQNPYLTDAFSLAVLGIALDALVTISRPVFTSSIVAGILARETVVPFALTWIATKQRKSAFVIILIAIVTYVVPRLLITKDISPVEYFATTIKRDGLIADPANFISQFAFAWGYILVFALCGFMFVQRSHRRRLATAFLILFIIALISCLVAVDFGRMFEVLGPILAVSSAQLIHTSRKTCAHASLIIIVLLMMVAIQCATLVPNALLPEQPPRLFRWAMEGAGLALTAVTYISIRRASQSQVWSVEKAVSTPSSP